MNRWQQRSLIRIVALVLFLSFSNGCSSFVANREQGFTMIQRGFSELEATPELHKELTLERIKVVIVGERQQFQWSKAAAENSSILGYATPTNEIWIFGKILNGEIVVNEAVLGHELAHLLHFQNKEMADPDKFRELDRGRSQHKNSQL